MKRVRFTAAIPLMLCATIVGAFAALLMGLAALVAGANGIERW